MVAPAEVMAVVKADAYGHGITQVANVAIDAGIGWIGTLDIATGLGLRAEGAHHDVALFAWQLGPVEDYAAAVSAGLDLGVSTIEQLDQIAGAGAGLRARVHLKIDTGLHRNGADAAHWPAVVRRAIELSESIALVGVWTHIAEASDEEDTDAIIRFHDAIAVAQQLGAAFSVRHLAASAASFARPDARFDLVRIGAFGYGIAPGGGVTPSSLGLEPVMTLTAPVISVEGGRATIPIGFGDGIPSSVFGRVPVALNGVLCDIVGIDVDTITLASGELPVRPGEIATLFGSGAAGEWTLQGWADALDTIGEEIVTRLSPGIRRRYIAL